MAKLQLVVVNVVEMQSGQRTKQDKSIESNSGPFDAPERQCARMSKITNDGLTRSGTGCLIAVPICQQWA